MHTQLFVGIFQRPHVIASFIIFVVQMVAQQRGSNKTKIRKIKTQWKNSRKSYQRCKVINKNNNDITNVKRPQTNEAFWKYKLRQRKEAKVV